MPETPDTGCGATTLEAAVIGGTCGVPPDDAGAAMSGAAGAVGGVVVAAAVEDAAAPDVNGGGGGNADSPRENAAAGDVGPDAVAGPADPAGDSPVPSPEGMPPKPPMPPPADNGDEPAETPPPPKPGNPPGERMVGGVGAAGEAGVGRGSPKGCEVRGICPPCSDPAATGCLPTMSGRPDDNPSPSGVSLRGSSDASGFFPPKAVVFGCGVAGAFWDRAELCGEVAR